MAAPDEPSGAPGGPRRDPPAGTYLPAARWDELQRVVDGALDLPAADRAAFIAAACADDAAVREHASRLVDACERAERADWILDPGAAALAAPVLAAASAVGGPGPTASLLDALRAALAGRYAVERELGRGGMATVYLAWDPRHERAVAIKVLERELVAPAGAERFLREIRIAARLTHPHIVPVHDSGEAGGLLYYVMPYVDGETLRARLARTGPLPVDDAVRLAREVADALDHAHTRGVVHRDVKPENVLLQGAERPHALVADFGIALAVEQAGGARLTRAGISLGTPQYMPPEQATGEHPVDARADVYALGCVLYEMLAGEPPFTGPSAQAIVARVSTQAPQPLALVRPSVPSGVEVAVMTALQKLPADRFQSAADFAAALADPAGTRGGPLAGAAGRGARLHASP